MSEQSRLRLIAEIEQRLEEFLVSCDISEEQKIEVLRELLYIALRGE